MNNWRREIAYHQPQRMVWPDLLLTVRYDEDDWHAIDPPAEELQYIECCAIRPVHVLNDCDRGRETAAEKFVDRVEHITPRGTSQKQVFEASSALDRDIAEGAKGSRCR